jgi:hypothetical protein
MAFIRRVSWSPPYVVLKDTESGEDWKNLDVEAI